MTESDDAAVKRAYWSERQGRRPPHAWLTSEQVRRLFAGIVDACSQRGELMEAFGWECVDDGPIVGTLGDPVEERLLIRLGRDDLWPVRPNVEAWDDDTLFDMMEFLHDHVSTGNEGSGRYHSYGNCGWHYSTFENEPARTEYRRHVNELLARLEPGYEMTSAGEIIRAAPEGMSHLVQAAPGLLVSDDRSHVEAAITKYRARQSTPTDRRDAVRDLADVLERRRDDVKQHLLSKDEAMLFEIVNKFWIRHNKPGEHRDYDHEAWWSWLFYVLLASITLVSVLADKEEGGPSSV